MKKGILLLIILASLSVLTGCVFQTTARNGNNYDDTGLVVVTGTYVYYMAGNNVDMFYYRGYWWSPAANGWQRAENYYGPWIVINVVVVPDAVVRLPERWRENLRYNDRIPYNDVKTHWRTWESDGYWKKRNWKKDEDNTSANDRSADERMKKIVDQKKADDKPANDQRIKENEKNTPDKKVVDEKQKNDQRVIDTDKKKTDRKSIDVKQKDKKDNVPKNEPANEKEKQTKKDKVKKRNDK